MWEAVGFLSKWAIPIALAGIPMFGILRGVKVYETFVEGAKESFETAVKLIPYLVGMLVAIAIFRESGALDVILRPIKPLLTVMGVPSKVIPIWIMRPISGSGALALLGDIMKSEGPDSMISKISSTIVGSTETTLYVIAVYFGSVGVRQVRYSLAVGLLADAICLFVAVAVCRLTFGG
jgi:spore maturation protein B